MKFCLGLLMAMLLLITACKKDHDDDNKVPPVEQTGCIERVYTSTKDHIINSADVAAVNKLFVDNNIDYSNFRYVTYIHSDSIQSMVRVDEFAKGLRLLSGNALFYFTKGILTFKFRMPIDVTGLDTVPHAQLKYLKWLFLNDIQKNKRKVYGNYVDSCLSAELGFYQLSGDSNTTIKTVKAWLVKGKASYPMGIYNDDGSTIVFGDGLVYLF